MTIKPDGIDHFSSATLVFFRFEKIFLTATEALSRDHGDSYALNLAEPYPVER